MTARRIITPSASADFGAGLEVPWSVALGVFFGVRRFRLLGQFLANFSVLTGIRKFRVVHGTTSQPIGNKGEPQLTATQFNC